MHNRFGISTVYKIVPVASSGACLSVHFFPNDRELIFHVPYTNGVISSDKKIGAWSL